MGRIIVIVLLMFPAAMGLGFLAVAAAAWNKSHDVAVIRSGFMHDYQSLAAIMGGVGLVIVFAVTIAMFFILKRKKPAPHEANF